MKTYLNKLYILFGLMLLILSLPTHAQHRNWQHRHYSHDRYHWVAPMIIGGAITYMMTRPQQPVVVGPYPGNSGQPIVLQPNQQIVCNNSYQVYSPTRGIYEVKSDCWIVQQ